MTRNDSPAAKAKEFVELFLDEVRDA